MKCKQCELEFSNGTKHQKFCDKRCRIKWWNDYKYRNYREQILLKTKTPEHKIKQNKYNKLPHVKQRRNEYLRKRRRSDPHFKLKTIIIDRTKHDKTIAKKFDGKSI